MKQIIALLAVALVWTAACTKLDSQIDGTYRSEARQEIVIVGGACVSFQENFADGKLAVRLIDFTTTGRYPDYVFTAKGQPDLTTVGPVTNFAIQVHFDDADTFMATPAGVIVGVDGVATGIPAEAIQFKRISANSKQTQN